MEIWKNSLEPMSSLEQRQIRPATSLSLHGQFSWGGAITKPEHSEENGQIHKVNLIYPKGGGLSNPITDVPALHDARFYLNSLASWLVPLDFVPRPAFCRLQRLEPVITAVD
jgi:hypothetical protein